MSFLWPSMLWLLVAVPLLVLGYVELVKRRAAARVELGTMAEVRTASGKPIGFRRHVPFGLFLVGVTFLVVGMARPETDVALPKRSGTVILAFDTSNSMRADDLDPTRMAAAKQAAQVFLDRQSSKIKIGVVAFSSDAFEVQEPTTVKANVRAAIRRLQPDGATSLGDGILVSLNAINGKPLGIDPRALTDTTPGAGVDFIGSSAVILLTDGENTSPLDPLAVTQVAAEAGVRVYTVGLGSREGAVIEVEGFQLATRLDEALLTEIADAGSGKYFRAENAQQLRDVYERIGVDIDLKLTSTHETTEITALFAAVGLCFFLAAGVCSMIWFGRVP